MSGDIYRYVWNIHQYSTVRFHITKIETPSGFFSPTDTTTRHYRRLTLIIFQQMKLPLIVDNLSSKKGSSTLLRYHVIYQTPTFYQGNNIFDQEKWLHDLSILLDEPTLSNDPIGKLAIFLHQPPPLFEVVALNVGIAQPEEIVQQIQQNEFEFTPDNQCTTIPAIFSSSWDVAAPAIFAHYDNLDLFKFALNSDTSINLQPWNKISLPVPPTFLTWTWPNAAGNTSEFPLSETTCEFSTYTTEFYSAMQVYNTNTTNIIEYSTTMQTYDTGTTESDAESVANKFTTLVPVFNTSQFYTTNTTNDDLSMVKELEKVFPALEHNIPCPAEQCFSERKDRGSLWQTIVHLNDYHHWNREQIADWLDTLPDDLTVIPLSSGD